MGKKRYRGHYCWMCGDVLPNENFSGRGHRDHICKKCRKLPFAKRQEKKDRDFLFNVLDQKNISKGNRKTIEEMLSCSAGLLKEEASVILQVAQLFPHKKHRADRLRKSHRVLFDELVRLGFLYDWIGPEEEDWREQRCLAIDTELQFLADHTKTI